MIFSRNIDELTKCIYKKGSICRMTTKNVKCEFFLKGNKVNYCLVDKILRQIKERSASVIILDDNKKPEELMGGEKLKYEIMKAIALGKGINVSDPNISLNFTSGSNFSKAANILMARFDIKLKKEFEEKRIPEKKIEREDEEDLNIDDEEEILDEEFSPEGDDDYEEVEDDKSSFDNGEDDENLEDGSPKSVKIDKSRNTKKKKKKKKKK